VTDPSRLGLPSLRTRIEAVAPGEVGLTGRQALSRTLLTGLPVLAQATLRWPTSEAYLVEDVDGYWAVLVRDDSNNNATTAQLEEAIGSTVADKLGFEHGPFTTIADALLSLFADVPLENLYPTQHRVWLEGNLALAYLDSGHELVEQVRVVLALALTGLLPALERQRVVRDNDAHWDDLVEAYRQALVMRDLPTGNKTWGLAAFLDHRVEVAELLMAPRDQWPDLASWFVYRRTQVLPVAAPPAHLQQPIA
jgi:hypothetical protein